MCRIEYADDESWCIQRPHVRKAAKDHRCDDCGRPIAKGEHYTYGAWIVEGDFMVAKMCAQCIEAGRWLRKVCGGFLYPGVTDELVEHWDEEFELRSLGLGRLVLAADRCKGRRNRSGWDDGHGGLIPVETVARWVDDALAHTSAEAMH